MCVGTAFFGVDVDYEREVQRSLYMAKLASNGPFQGGFGSYPGVTVAGPQAWSGLVSAWNRTTPWNEAARMSRPLGLGAAVALGLVACFTLVNATVRGLSRDSLAASCKSASECNELGARFAAAPAGSEGALQDAAPKDAAMASRLFQRACDLGSAAGCNNLGLAYKRAQGVPEDYVLAMTSFERACSGGLAEGCSNQGVLYEHGLGVSVNLGDAQRLYQQACRRGSALGCSNLGALYAQGRGVVADQQAAARLFGDACSAGSAIGCSNLFEFEPHPTASAVR
jgi:Sel1 repeat-containing protein